MPPVDVPPSSDLSNHKKSTKIVSIGTYNLPPATPILEVPPQEQLLGKGGRHSYLPPTRDVKDAHVGSGPSDNPQNINILAGFLKMVTSLPWC